MTVQARVNQSDTHWITSRKDSQRRTEAYREGGQNKAAKHIPTSLLEEFSIIGTPEECAERMDLPRKAGIKHFAALLPGDLKDRLDFLNTYAAKIIPKIG